MCGTTEDLQAKTHRSSRPLRKGIWITALIVLSLMAVAPSLADVVELKTGQRVEGTFKQATPSGIVIEVGGQIITFEQEKVRAIYFGPAPAPTQSQPSALAEAMKALKAIQFVTYGGVSYRDYAPRVSDAKIVVDRYLQEPAEQGRGEVRSAIAACNALLYPGLICMER